MAVNFMLLGTHADESFGIGFSTSSELKDFGWPIAVIDGSFTLWIRV
jgi:hypothetical protein